MLTGERIVLRARQEADVPVLHAELYDDVEVRSRADSRPWRPVAAHVAGLAVRGSRPHRRRRLLLGGRAGRRRAGGGGAAVGDRSAQPSRRTSGCRCGRTSAGGAWVPTPFAPCVRYGFALRGLHRRPARNPRRQRRDAQRGDRAGFTVEGTLRRYAWVNGDFVDEVLCGLLAAEWTAVRRSCPRDRAARRGLTAPGRGRGDVSVPGARFAAVRPRSNQ